MPVHVSEPSRRPSAAAVSAPGVGGRVLGAGDGRKSYLAFHHGCPHRYLAPSSVEAIRAAHQRYPDFILGRVTRCDAREASDADNPFRLPPGTAFHVLTVESL